MPTFRFMEHNEKTDLWTDLPPHQYKIFWPETASMEMYVKYRDSKLTSQAFFIATPHHTVLRMDKGVNHYIFSATVKLIIIKTFRVHFRWK